MGKTVQRKKIARVQFMAAPEEAASIRREAERCGLTQGDYIRALHLCALNGRGRLNRVLRQASEDEAPANCVSKGINGVVLFGPLALAPLPEATWLLVKAGATEGELAIALDSHSESRSCDIWESRL